VKKITEIVEEKQQKFVENIDYYFDNGLMVLTSIFLLKRGYCCGNGCRHCPYSKDEKSTLE
jgi:Family of unknown function (DUF5522)